MAARAYWKAFKVSLQTKFEYRSDLFLGVGGALGLQAAGLGTMWMVLSQSQGLDGWTGKEVALLFGLTTMINGCSELFFNHIWFVPIHVVQGQIDRLLVYPVKSLPFYLLTSPELHALGNLGGGLIIYCLAANSLGLPWWAYAFLPFWIACGSLVYSGALVVCGAISFYFPGPRSQHYFVVQSLLQASRYPLGVFPGAMQIILLFLVPFSAVSFFPVDWALHRLNPLYAFGSPLLAAGISVWVAFKAWDWGLRKYESTGS